MIKRLSLCVGLAAAAAAPARADSTTDFKNGSSVYIEHITVHAGPVVKQRRARRILKPAGALSFAVDATDLGVDLPIQLHLHGTTLAGGFIQFTFDDTYSNVDVTGNGDMLLTRVAGSIKARLTAMAAADAPTCGGTDCNGSAYFNVVSGTATAYGTWGTTTMTIDLARGVAGVSRPRMEQLTSPPATRDSQHKYTLPFCSSSTASVAPFGIWLASPAPPSGARIELTAPTGSGVTSPGTIVLGAGVRSAILDLKVPANFAGTLAMTAAAGGSLKTVNFTVRAASQCSAPPSTPAYEPYAASSLVGCLGCSTFVDINGRGDQLTSINGQLRVIRDGTATALAKLFPAATSIDAEAIDDLGWIAGRMTINGVNQAYRADTVHGSYDLLGQMTPLDISPSGVAVGFHVNGGASHAAYSNGHGIVEIPLASSYGIRASRALHVADTGQVVGTYTDGSGVVRGFRWVRGTTYTLPVVGTKPAIPVAINHANQIAANGDSAVIMQANGVMTQLGSPNGYSSFKVTSLNRWGYAVGVATSIGITNVQRAFAWIPGRGFVALSEYARGLSNVDNALRITDANQIVVHGIAAGVTDLYLLTL